MSSTISILYGSTKRAPCSSTNDHAYLDRLYMVSVNAVFCPSITVSMLEDLLSLIACAAEIGLPSTGDAQHMRNVSAADSTKFSSRHILTERRL